MIELNEAFAAQSLAVIQEARLDPTHVNVNGGAIALGHPLGCTGAKLTASIIRELKRRNGHYGMVTMCVGGGMGAAGIFENFKHEIDTRDTKVFQVSCRDRISRRKHSSFEYKAFVLIVTSVFKALGLRVLILEDVRMTTTAQGNKTTRRKLSARRSQPRQRLYPGRLQRRPADGREAGRRVRDNEIVPPVEKIEHKEWEVTRELLKKASEWA